MPEQTRSVAAVVRLSPYVWWRGVGRFWCGGWLVLLPAPACAVERLVDDFSTAQAESMVPLPAPAAPGNVAGNFVPDNMLGGERDLAVRVFTNFAPGTVDGFIKTAVLSGESGTGTGRWETKVRFQKTDPNASNVAITAIVRCVYDGNDGDPQVENLMATAVDVTAGGTHDSFLCRVNISPVPPSAPIFQVTFRTSATERTIRTVELNGSRTYPADLVFPLAGNGSANLMEIRQVALDVVVSSNQSVEYTVTVEQPRLLTPGVDIPVLEVTPASLVFDAIEGGGNPASQPITVQNTGGGSLFFDIASSNPDLVGALPFAGVLGAGLSQVVDVAAANPNQGGTHNATLTVSAAGAQNSPQTVAVSVVVPPPVLEVTPDSLAFKATEGGGNPASQPITVRNTGGSSLSFVTSSVGLFPLTALPFAGLVGPGGSQVVNVGVVNTDVVGTHNASLIVSAAGAQGSPKSVGASLVVAPQETDDPTGNVRTNDPIGSFAGNFTDLQPVDLDLGNGVFLQRHYDSALFTDGVITSALGPNWQHNYDVKLTVTGAGTGARATIGFSNGRVIAFLHDGTAWNLVGRARLGFRLFEIGAEFLLVDPRSQLRHFFDSAGRLVRLDDGRGNVVTLTYDANGRLATVSDGLGRTLTFAYDGSGRLISVTDGPRTVLFGYTGNNLASFTDAAGKATTYAYDTSNAVNPGLLTAKTWPEGNAVVTQVYNAQGRVQSQTDGANHTTNLAYAQDAASRTTTITDPLGNAQVHIYNARGALTRITDEAGNHLDVGVDANDRRNTVLDRRGNTTGITYDAASGLPTKIDHAGNPDDGFAYATRAVSIGGVNVDLLDRTQITRPDGTNNAFTYDATGNLTRYTLRDGAHFDFTHNNRGQVLTATNPTAGVATFTYDASARLASARDTDTGTFTHQYDALHRLTGITNPDATTRVFAYDALNRVTSASDERGNTFSYQYDGNSRLTKLVDPAAKEITFAYDAVNRLTGIKDRLGNSSVIEYEARGLVSRTTNRNGNATQRQYDARRRLTGIVDPAGKTSTYTYDNDGLLTAAANPLGETVTFTYDALGYPASVTDSLLNTVTFGRDDMKRVTLINDSLGREAAFTYDARGQFARVTREEGIAADYTYDDFGSLESITDPGGSTWTFDYTPSGRPTAVTDPLLRVTAHVYDSRGRPGVTTFADGVTLTRTYDAAGNVTRLLYSDGTDLNYTYDALNRPVMMDNVAVTYDANGQPVNTSSSGVNFGATFDPGGRLTSVTYPNPAGGQFAVSYTYDTRDRLTRVSDTLTGTTIDFAHDDAHRVTSITRPSGVNTTYTYDAAGRVTRIQEGAIIDLRYTYDAAGQVTEADYVTVPLDPATALAAGLDSFAHDAASQITNTGYAFDARGRLAHSPAPDTTYTWDGASRLRAIGAVTFTYNGLDDVLTRTVGGATTRFFYNLALGRRPIVAERDEATTQFTRFPIWSPGGLLVYLINLPGNAVSFPHFDRVGSTLALTNAAGAVTDSYAYDPYGRLLTRTGPSTQPFQFNGQFGVRVDPAVAGLLHMRARYYDARTARFISKEPIWPVLGNPAKLNPYQFALRNPVALVDPTGREEEYPSGISGETQVGLSLAAIGFYSALSEEVDDDDDSSPFFIDPRTREYSRPGITDASDSASKAPRAGSEPATNHGAYTYVPLLASSGSFLEQYLSTQPAPTPHNRLTSAGIGYAMARPLMGSGSAGSLPPASVVPSRGPVMETPVPAPQAFVPWKLILRALGFHGSASDDDDRRDATDDRPRSIFELLKKLEIIGPSIYPVPPAFEDLNRRSAPPPAGNPLDAITFDEVIL